MFTVAEAMRCTASSRHFIEMLLRRASGSSYFGRAKNTPKNTTSFDFPSSEEAVLAQVSNEMTT